MSSESEGDLAEALLEWLVGAVALVVGLGVGLVLVDYASVVRESDPLVFGIALSALVIPFGIGRFAVAVAAYQGGTQG